MRVTVRRGHILHDDHIRAKHRTVTVLEPASRCVDIHGVFRHEPCGDFRH